MYKTTTIILILVVMLSFSEWHKKFCKKDHYGCKPSKSAVSEDTN